jgi:hypothetical protein
MRSFVIVCGVRVRALPRDEQRKIFRLKIMAVSKALASASPMAKATTALSVGAAKLPPAFAAIRACRAVNTAVAVTLIPRSCNAIIVLKPSKMTGILHLYVGYPGVSSNLSEGRFF